MLNPALENFNFLGGESLADWRHALGTGVSTFDGGEKGAALWVTRNDEDAKSSGFYSAFVVVKTEASRLGLATMAGDAFRLQNGFDVPREIYGAL